MKVLVTGGAGYVGSQTCKALKEAGHTPVVLDNLVYGHEWAVQWGPLYKLHLSETDKVTQLLGDEKIEAVLHFAAFAYVGESVKDPLKYYENNFAGTISLLRALQKAQVQKMVFSSTCATYGVPRVVPITESSVQMPINPYGQSKLMIEKVLQDLANIHALKSVALRYFNAAGADPDGEIGEDHNPETHLIPLALAAAYLPDQSLTVFGTDYPTADGTCVRDYIHVSDLARAHVAALKYLSREPHTFTFDAFNLGTGVGQSVKAVIDGVEKVTGQKVKVKYGPRRDGDPAELVASPGRALEALGWRTERSSLEEILRDADRWFRKHHLKQRV